MPEGVKSQIAQVDSAIASNNDKLKELQSQYDAARSSGDSFSVGVLEMQIAKTSAIGQRWQATKQLLETDLENANKKVNKQEEDQLKTTIEAAQGNLELSSSRLKGLKNQAKQYESQITITEAEEIKQRYKERLKDFDERRKLLDANLAAGVVSEQEYNDQVFIISRERANEELKEIERRRKLLNPKDKEGLEALNAEAAEVAKKQYDELSGYYEKQVALLERAQKKAADAITLAETERLTEIQELQNQDLITQTEAEQLRVDLTGDRIAKELQLERDKLAELERMPKYSDPVKEEERQARIRQSRQRTAQLTGQLVENQGSKEEALTRRIQEQIQMRFQAFKNASDREQLALEKTSALQDSLVKSLDRQNKLLQTRKELSNSLANFYTGELEILAETAKSEGERKQLAQSIAGIKLQNLVQQQRLERELLENDVKRRDLALELEAIGNRQAQAQNVADIAESRANIAKVEASKETMTPEQYALELDAAQKNLDAKLLQGGVLAYTAEQLEVQKVDNAKLAEVERANLVRSQQVDYDRADLTYAQSITNPTARSRAVRMVEDRVQQRALGTTDDSEARAKVRRSNEDFTANQYGFLPSFIPSDLRFNTAAPEFNLPPTPSFDAALTKFLQNQLPAVVLQTTEKNASLKNEQPVLTGDLNMENTIQFFVRPEDKQQIAVDLEGTVLDSLGKVFGEVKQRLGS